jgi:hypothetical protein
MYRPGLATWAKLNLIFILTSARHGVSLERSLTVKRKPNLKKYMNIQDILVAINGVGSGVQYASFTYTAKGSGEVARHKVLLGASYDNALRKSLRALKMARYSDPIKRQAQIELIASFELSLTSHANGESNPDYTKKDVYVESGISQVKISENDGHFKLIVQSVGKVILQPGVYKVVKSAPKTIAKNELRRRLPIGRVREFELSVSQLESARITGNELIID